MFEFNRFFLVFRRTATTFQRFLERLHKLCTSYSRSNVSKLFQNNTKKSILGLLKSISTSASLLIIYTKYSVKSRITANFENT